MTPRLILIPLIDRRWPLPMPRRMGAGQGHGRSKAAAAAGQSRRSQLGAKELFGRKVLPAAARRSVVGFYAKGCIAGAEALPINGDTWQVMRLSRNRNWAHPQMVALVERLSAKAQGSRAGRACWSATCRSRAAGRC